MFSEDELYKKIGERVRKAREKAKLTQQDLAKLSDLTRTSITNLEAGQQRVRVHTLFNIAEALGVSPEVLLPLPDKSSTSEASLITSDTKLDEIEMEWVKRVLDDK